MSRFVELNHVLHDRMPVYPGLPVPRVEPLVTHDESRGRYEGKAEFYLGKVDMPCNTGTYLDSPFHRFRDRQDLSELPLQAVAGLPGVVIDATDRASRAISVDEVDLPLEGRAALFRTDWDRRWGAEAYWRDSPYLAEGTVRLLVRSGAALVGVDFMNVDDTDDPSRPAHTHLLGSGIPVVEHLRDLASLPPQDFRFYAVPLRITRGASFPVRAFAEIG